MKPFMSFFWFDTKSYLLISLLLCVILKALNEALYIILLNKSNIPWSYHDCQFSSDEETDSAQLMTQKLKT